MREEGEETVEKMADPQIPSPDVVRLVKEEVVMEKEVVSEEV